MAALNCDSLGEQKTLEQIEFSRLEAAPTNMSNDLFYVGAASSREEKSASKENQFHVDF